MWLATKFGFFSIVNKGDCFHVRARVKKDLENLIEASGLPVKIIESDVNDYQFRILIDQPELAKVMSTLASSVDYSNFKDHIHSLPDQAEKSEAYSAIWGIMAKFQWNNQDFNGFDARFEPPR